MPLNHIIANKDSVTGIVVVNWNRLPITRQSLDSLVINTILPHKIIIVDNHTTDDFDNVDGVEIKRPKYSPSTVEYVESLLNDGKINYILRNAGNYGLGFGRNVGFSVLTTTNEWQKNKIDFVFIADNDLSYPPNWLKITYDLWNDLHVSHNIGAIMFSNCPEHMPKTILEYSNGKMLYIKNPCAGNATFMPADLFAEMGQFPTTTDIGNEDWTLCRKLREANYNILNCDWLLEHIGKGHSLWLGPGR